MSTKSTTTKFFDAIDSIDRYLYGRKMKNFIIGALLVVIAAPLLDAFLEVPHDRLTFYATLTFFLYSLLLLLTWLSSFRDDSGKWTWKKVSARLVTYFHILKNTAKTTHTNSRDERLYKAGRILIIGSICWKALQNLSVFIRKPMEKVLDVKIIRLRNFESIALYWYLPTLAIGVVIMVWLVRNNKQILIRIKQDTLHVLGSRKHNNQYIGAGPVLADEVVISCKSDDHINKVVAINNSTHFGHFMRALRTWTPINCRLEYEYQNSLLEHLAAELPNSLIDSEYPIPDPSGQTRKRADIVIDDNILIEMKRETNAGEIQRAQGQIHQYTTLWNRRGPVILLLCNHEYDQARAIFEPTMRDLHKLDRPALTVVQSN